MGLRRDEQTDALFRSILSLKSIEECYCYFEDLCTNKEVRDFGQRLEIAKELDEGHSYQRVAETTVSSSDMWRSKRRSLSLFTSRSTIWRTCGSVS